MMAWSSSSNPNGGGGGVADPNEILVFGYACKLFRDDDKANWIEEEKHLIPWMGDQNVRIDRYDGRGHLMDLEKQLGDGQGEPMEGVSLKNQELERELEYERYRDLREDEEFNDGNYQEVEFKKFQWDVNDSMSKKKEEGYAAIGYEYEDGQKEEGEGRMMKVEDERPFVSPKGLTVPEGMVLPPTMKLHSIIEKTAKFIASHGSQMEIILKTKQANNPLFDFLDYKNQLNPYFKFLVQAIKDQVYKPQEFQDGATENVEPQKSSDPEDSGDDEGYLHPSLFSSTTSTIRLPGSSINFKANPENCAYSLLVSKIKGSTNADTPPPPPPPSQPNSYQSNTNGCYSQYQSQMYYYAQNSGVFPPLPGYPDPTNRPPNQVPNANDQLVIEKMANYVVKNGPAFEELARSKGDSRFVFLNPTHEYHWYYLNCKERFKVEAAAVVASRQFVSYSNDQHEGGSSGTSTPTPGEVQRPPEPKKFVLKSVELPLSASGIPIANMESISNRPTSLPPEVASRIEQLKKKSAIFAKKESSPPKIQFSSSIGKAMNIGYPLDNEEPPIIDDGIQIGPQPEPICDSSSSSDGDEDSRDRGTGDEFVPEQAAESDEERLKRIRRQKAALFLQKIGAKKIDASTSCSSQPTNNQSGVLKKAESSEEFSPAPVIQEDRSTSNEKRLTSQNSEKRAGQSQKHHRGSPSGSNRSRSRNKSGSHSSKRSHSMSSGSPESMESQSQSHKKKHKRKSSKKRKKKRDRSKSRSPSNSSRKKSKKHKR